MFNHISAPVRVEKISSEFCFSCSLATLRFSFILGQHDVLLHLTSCTDVH